MFKYIVVGTGDNLGAFMLKEGVVREMQISAPSLAWLMPSKQLWKENEVLVETDKKNYTVNDFEDFFRLVKLFGITNF